MLLFPCQSQFLLTGFTVLTFMLLQLAIKDNVDKQEILYSLIRWKNLDHCHNTRKTKQNNFLGPEYLEFISTVIRKKFKVRFY